MKIVVISNESQKKELEGSLDSNNKNIHWVSSPDQLNLDAEVIIDLLFDETPDHLAILKSYSSQLIMINSVVNTLKESDTSFVRINGTNTGNGRRSFSASVAGRQIRDQSGYFFQPYSYR